MLTDKPNACFGRTVSLSVVKAATHTIIEMTVIVTLFERIVPSRHELLSGQENQLITELLSL